MTNGYSDDFILEFLKGRDVAIVGLSPDKGKPSYAVAAYLKKRGYNIFPVYPKAEEILGFKVAKSLKDIPAVDTLVIFRKSEAVESVVKEALECKCANRIWVQLGIFSPNAKRLCMDSQIPYIENRCIAIEHERLL